MQRARRHAWRRAWTGRAAARRRAASVRRRSAGRGGHRSVGRRGDRAASCTCCAPRTSRPAPPRLDDLLAAVAARSRAAAGARCWCSAVTAGAGSAHVACLGRAAGRRRLVIAAREPLRLTGAAAALRRRRSRIAAEQKRLWQRRSGASGRARTRARRRRPRSSGSARGAIASRAPRSRTHRGRRAGSRPRLWNACRAMARGAARRTGAAHRARRDLGRSGAARAADWRRCARSPRRCASAPGLRRLGLRRRKAARPRRQRAVHRPQRHRQDAGRRGAGQRAAARPLPHRPVARWSANTSARPRRTCASVFDAAEEGGAHPAVRRGRRAVRQAQRGEGQPRPLRQYRGQLSAAADGGLSRAWRS